MADVEEPTRTFKTAWFSKAARKARIKDGELCKAIQEVMDGQADDLGGGVFEVAMAVDLVGVEGLGGVVLDQYPAALAGAGGEEEKAKGESKKIFHAAFARRSSNLLYLA